MVRLKITRQPLGTIDGIGLGDFVVGFTYDVGTMLACYLLAERFAEPVADESLALVLPVRSQIRFGTNLSHEGKVIPIHETQFHTAPPELTEAADRPARRRKRR